MKALLKNILNHVGYQITGTRFTPRQLLDRKNLRQLEFDDVICRRMFESGSELAFIQVGAFDGMVQDPLRKYIANCSWRGVMVEPQAYAAEKLRQLYAGNDRVAIVQAAIDGQAGQRTLYTVDRERAPAWAGALASFQQETILRHADLIPDLATMIRSESVDCIGFDAVLAKLPANRIDLLQIDTEGADADILVLFPFHRLRPAIVHWEIRHLSLRQREECLGRLVEFGYRFATSGDQDMLALLF